MAFFFRRLVSQNKNRHVEDGFDLDLTYLTEQIICMGLPASGAEAVYRNPIEQVVRFLELHHSGHYKVFNLCNERSYDISLFGDACASFPFDDHGAPPLDLIIAFCSSAKSWLIGGMQNVVAVHCKAGKGRTGLMSSALVLHLGYQKTAAEAIAFYNNRRTRDGKGLTVPSQRRYVGYYARVLAGEAHTGVHRMLESIALIGAPAKRARLVITVQQHGATRPEERAPHVVVLGAEPGSPSGAMREARCAMPVGADLKFEVADGETGATLCRLWIHPALEPSEATYVLQHEKGLSDLDVVEKKALPAGFMVRLRFSAPTSPMMHEDSSSLRPSDEDLPPSSVGQSTSDEAGGSSVKVPSVEVS